MSAEQQITRDVVVSAPPSVVFNVLADPRKHTEFDGSGTVKQAVSGPDRLSMGAKFGTSMKMFGVPYRIPNTVVEFEEDRLIAWAHPGKHRWRYELEQVDGGTRVTETCDFSTSPAGAIMARLPVARWNAEGIEKTLPKLKALVENGG